MTNLSQNSVISVAFVGEEESARLNREFRGKEGATPVLAFPQEYKEDDGEETIHQFTYSPNNPRQLGDVVICLPMTERLAKESGRKLKKQILKLVEHGVGQLIEEI